LAAKIELLANNPDLRRKMGAAGRERIVKNFSLREMVKKIEAVYEDVVSKQACNAKSLAVDARIAS